MAAQEAETLQKSETTTTTTTVDEALNNSNAAVETNENEQKQKQKQEKEEDEEEEDPLHPKNHIDHRPQNGPLLDLLWCTEAPLAGQTLYLGGEVGSDGKIYCVPGHAPRVLVIDPETDKISLIGPELSSNGTKFKWLRGVPVGDVIYGLPCHASDVLKIHIPTQTVTKLPIPYEEFYKDSINNNNSTTTAQEQREMIWKYHGGSVSPIDDCIYAIPQSAAHVLKVDPKTDTCSLVGPYLEGKYKWYGGVVGDVDGAIYGIPHNSPSVLRITPTSITLHGDYGNGGHKWHGASKAGNGVIVCVPSNEDTVLCITPGDPEPILTEIGDAATIQSGRHRSDGKYKYLGAMVGTNGKVYVFPSASEYVLEVDAVNNVARNVGPNLRDTGMERVHQNKWQNGLTNPHDQCVYGIPLAGQTLLRVDCSQEPPEVTTWNLPSPYKSRDKWEGGVLTSSGIIYTVPNNCKAVLRIQPFKFKKEDFPRISEPIPTESDSETNKESEMTNPDENTSSSSSSGSSPSPTTFSPPSPTTTTSNNGNNNTNNKSNNNNTNNNKSNNKNSNKNNNKKKIASEREYGGDDDGLIYKSGIPTLRSSAHRVKFDMKSRKHDPKPLDRTGKETSTTWLPEPLLREDVFDYDLEKYDLRGAIVSLLKNCDSDIVGSFSTTTTTEKEEESLSMTSKEEKSSSSVTTSATTRLEDFRVPVSSIWRSVNGGNCESAQKYLSDAVAANDDFLNVFDTFVREVALPYIKRRLVVDSKAVPTMDTPVTFYYQRPPTIRLQPGPGWAKVKPHNDAEYGHQNGELNFWVPLTDRELNGVDLWCETTYNANDYHRVPAKIGQAISFHGSSCRHYVNSNGTEHSRVSIDFRIGVQGFFDPYWQMKGTTDDHGRTEVTI